MESKSTRRSQRRTLVLEVQWTAGERTGVDYTINLSDHGLFLATTEVLVVGEVLHLTIIGPRDMRITGAEGVVRWRLDSNLDVGAGVGIEFSRLPDDAVSQIRELSRIAPKDA